MDFEFFITSAGLGIGLAMDAFSVSLANGLHEPQMRKRKMSLIAGIFAVFQGIMPMLGWICVHTVLQYFQAFEKAIPWIALILLVFIGGKMLIDGLKKENEENPPCIGCKGLLVQAVATSIDALSVGFTIAEYQILEALVCAGVITAITFAICLFGVLLGKKVGMKYADKATILGGVILIVIGIEIFLTGIL